MGEMRHRSGDTPEAPVADRTSVEQPPRADRPGGPESYDPGSANDRRAIWAAMDRATKDPAFALSPEQEKELKRARSLSPAEAAGYKPPADSGTKEESADRPGRQWKTIAEETGEVRSYDSYASAKRDLGSRPGEEIHHIVEQAQAKPERSGFSVERVNTTDNLVRLPVDTHRAISSFYSSKPPGAFETVRDSLNGESWDYQYEFGAKTIDRAQRDELK